MLWTSTGPILLIKYIVDQRRSDFAHNIGDWVVYPKVVPSSFRSKTGAPKCPQGPNQWKLLLGNCEMPPKSRKMRGHFRSNWVKDRGKDWGKRPGWNQHMFDLAH